MTSSVSLNANSTHSRSQLPVLNTSVADSTNLTSTRSCCSLATVGKGTVLVQLSVSQALKPAKDNTKLATKLGGSLTAKEGELTPGCKENVDKGKKADTLGVESTSGSSSSTQADHMAPTQGCCNLKNAKETVTEIELLLTGDDPQTMPNMPTIEMKRKPDKGDLETDDTYAPGSNSFAALVNFDGPSPIQEDKEHGGSASTYSHFGPHPEQITLDVDSSIVSPVVAPGGQGNDSVAEGPEEALNEYTLMIIPTFTPLNLLPPHFINPGLIFVNFSIKQLNTLSSNMLPGDILAVIWG
ncbi:hypothetical protein EDD18DRAFT_1105239 [Armillaria luteobubalina]|uniref:Uncharacterized protein n=1 Tax=Armillaria luteobubalina TaxID=153913 RepID=A0AA39Q844_9AGAR|nr:hypothetical protein EDD18DRAFT_1105239 [Armillaria luteobubalina]